MKRVILHVAVSSPLRKVFDYLPPLDCDKTLLIPGIRLRIPFGRQKHAIGFLLAVDDKTDIPAVKLKPAHQIIDEYPLLNQKQIDLLLWASQYYQYPIGEVIFSSLPGPLRQGDSCEYPKKKYYRVVTSQNTADQLGKAEKQRQLLQRFLGDDKEYSIDEIKCWQEYTAHSLSALVKKNLVQKLFRQQRNSKPSFDYLSLPKATTEQGAAIGNIVQSLDRYQSFLLNGITGSGKTHVYMEAVQHVIQSGKQVLILLPEIGLTPQFLQRFQNIFKTDIALYHSGLTERQRLKTWMQARDHSVSIFIGTRSAIWLPLKDPGLIIVDEEHDLSYKQQEGFRYSARDIAVYRARQENIPVVLGSATPSMESLHNLTKSHYRELTLTQRIGEASLPEIATIDLKNSAMTGAFSQPLLDAIKITLQQNQQVLLFMNLRGYAPAMLCHQCGYVNQCQRCDRPMTYHKQRQIIWCHHCDKQLPITMPCPQCDEQAWIEVGHGTERIEDDIAELFPDYQTIRIDRDTTRLKGSLEQHLSAIQNNEAQILIGTQMLAKGHDFPNLSLVGIVDLDSSLYSTDFRASERMAQLFTQVSGRAGRATKPGRVLLQTHQPEHPLLNCLINEGYNAFANLLLQQRHESRLPPFSYHALLRAESTERDHLQRFLNEAKQQLHGISNRLMLYGPVPSAIPRKAGKHRMQLLLETDQRSQFAQYLRTWIARISDMKSAKKIRWSIDIDPLDMI